MTFGCRLKSGRVLGGDELERVRLGHAKESSVWVGILELLG